MGLTLVHSLWSLSYPNIVSRRGTTGWVTPPHTHRVHEFIHPIFHDDGNSEGQGIGNHRQLTQTRTSPSQRLHILLTSRQDI